MSLGLTVIRLRRLALSGAGSEHLVALADPENSPTSRLAIAIDWHEHLILSRT